MSSIGFKDLKVLRGMFETAWHPSLISLLIWMVVRYSKDKILLTSAYRKGDKGVHGTLPLRGFDLRSYVFDNPEKICDDINTCFKYDPERPDKKCAIYHDVGKGKHIHIQCHPNTIFLKKECEEESQ